MITFISENNYKVTNPKNPVSRQPPYLGIPSKQSGRNKDISIIYLPLQTFLSFRRDVLGCGRRRSIIKPFLNLPLSRELENMNWGRKHIGTETIPGLHLKGNFIIYPLLSRGVSKRNLGGGEVGVTTLHGGARCDSSPPLAFAWMGDKSQLEEGGH